MIQSVNDNRKNLWDKLRNEDIWDVVKFLFLLSVRLIFSATLTRNLVAIATCYTRLSVLLKKKSAGTVSHLSLVME